MMNCKFSQFHRVVWFQRSISSVPGGLALKRKNAKGQSIPGVTPPSPPLPPRLSRIKRRVTGPRTEKDSNPFSPLSFSSPAPPHPTPPQSTVGDPGPRTLPGWNPRLPFLARMLKVLSARRANFLTKKESVLIGRRFRFFAAAAVIAAFRRRNRRKQKAPIQLARR